MIEVARSKMKKKNETCHVNSIQIRQNHNKNNQRKKKKKVDILSLTCTFASPEATSAPHNFESFFPWPRKEDNTNLCKF